MSASPSLISLITWASGKVRSLFAIHKLPDLRSKLFNPVMEINLSVISLLMLSLLLLLLLLRGCVVAVVVAVALFVVVKNELIVGDRP